VISLRDPTPVCETPVRIIDRLAVTGSEGAIGIGFQMSHTDFKCVRKQPIVAIKKNDVLATTVEQPTVSRGGRGSRVRLIDASNLGKARCYIPASIGRTIVYHDNFEVRISLREDAFDCVT
jgi:hypothetical protein